MTFRRSVELLARLAAVEPRDSGWKAPSQSLGNIFRCWMPQTLVTAEGRLRELERLLERFPTVGWPLLLQSIDEDDDVGEFNSRPRWRRRSVDYGDVQAVTHEEIQAAADLLLSRPHYEGEQLTELVKHLKDFTVADQKKVLQLIESWHRTEGTEEAEQVRSALRQYVLGRSDTPDDIRSMVAALVDRLASEDEVLKNAWLFGGFWDVDKHTEAGVEDWSRRLERHRQQQVTVVKSLYDRYGLTGLRQLAEKSENPKEVGAAVAGAAWPPERLAEFVAEAVSGGDDRSQVVVGWMAGEPRARVADVLRLVKTWVTAETFLVLLLQAPFASEVWQLSAGDDALAKAY